jgi:hypothetical protein
MNRAARRYLIEAVATWHFEFSTWGRRIPFVRTRWSANSSSALVLRGQLIVTPRWKRGLGGRR